MPWSLPPNPPTIRPLRDVELERLESFYDTTVLPRSVARCVTCGGQHFFTWASPITGEVADWVCRCDEQYLLSLFLFNAGIDLLYQRFTWSDTHACDPQAKAIVVDYSQNAHSYVNQGLGLLFYGRQGTGKTLLIMLLLKKLLGLGYDGYATTFQNLVANFASGWHDEDRRKWFLKRVTNAGILVIDDIGKESKSEFKVDENTTVRRPAEMVHSMLDEILRSRVAGCRPTFITTNLSMTELRQMYGPPPQSHEDYRTNIMSLLNETMQQHEFTNDDYREDALRTRRQIGKRGLCRPIFLGLEPAIEIGV